MKLPTLLLLPMLSLAVPAWLHAAEPATAASPSSVAASEQPLLVVNKTPWCGCCEVWAAQAEQAGFTVERRVVEDLNPIKRALGVPSSQASCHTAEVGGYFIEGHVPFADVRRLLAERPQARGLAVPGMPLGSPGMEADAAQAYSVNLIDRDGGISEYARHNDGRPAAHGHQH